MRVLFVAAAAVATACGLDLVGAAPPITAPSPEAGASTPSGTLPPTTSTQSPPKASTADASTDAGTVDHSIPDAGVTTPRNPDRVAVVYGAIGNGIVVFDLAANTFEAGSFTNCPALEEVAVNSAGEVWVTSTSGDELLTYKHATGCTSVQKAAKSSYPIALTFVPEGLQGATEALVGYRGKDYVRIDATSHLPVVILANALGDFVPSGDLVAVGSNGYFGAKLAAAPCSGACIVEVDLRTGRPGKVVVSMPSGQGVFGLGHALGKLVVLNGQGAQRFDLNTLAFGIISGPANTRYNGAGSAPYPPL
jgi:hypothetical protein